MSETELQDAILRAAVPLGWLAYHTYDSRRSTAGFPDLALVRAPRLILAELKDAKGRVSPDQSRWAHELELVAAVVEDLAGVAISTGGLVVYRLWRPADWDSGAILRELQAKAVRP